MIESEADSKRLDLAVDFPTNEFVNEVQYNTPPPGPGGSPGPEPPIECGGA